MEGREDEGRGKKKKKRKDKSKWEVTSNRGEGRKSPGPPHTIRVVVEDTRHAFTIHSTSIVQLRFGNTLHSCKIFLYVFCVRKYFYNENKANYDMLLRTYVIHTILKALLCTTCNAHSNLT